MRLEMIITLFKHVCAVLNRTYRRDLQYSDVSRIACISSNILGFRDFCNWVFFSEYAKVGYMAVLEMSDSRKSLREV